VFQPLAGPGAALGAVGTKENQARGNPARNDRRVLWCEVTLNARPLLVASIRNDSFDLDNNLRQVGQILEKLDGRPTLVAGDFNASAEQPAMRRWRESNLFTATWDGPPTFPSDAPRERIDNILAPIGWKLVSSEVLSSDLSDHLPVLSVFEIREEKMP
jgi:endonuclease/exonuclease/phosphatase family metal-dependent hydrolase